MSDSMKPRVRVAARSSNFTADAAPRFVGDSFQNFTANLGYGTNNLSSGSTYGFNPLSRNRSLLDWMYRGSWLVRKVVDCPADDMTREGITITSDMKPDALDEYTKYWTDLQLWQRLNAGLKWARLYGGCIVVPMIAGQDTETPLRIETVGKGSLRGLLVLDRWQVQPYGDLVQDFGPYYGTPEYYTTVADARAIPRLRIHHSRCLRFDGIELPYWQRTAENEWGLSCIEPLWDRMIAFDSATTGAAQLIYKAHLRVLKLPDFRSLIALGGGAAYQGMMQQIMAIRSMQANEGMTILDKDDEFEVNQYAFGGLSDMMVQFGQQVAGAADIPMTRLFGQSPAGMNATGESDLRNYYDGVRSIQEARLRRPVKLLCDLTYRSLHGEPLPEGFNFMFTPLWQLTATEKATIASQHAQSTTQLLQDQVFTVPMALREMRQSSRVTGFGGTISDEDIQAAENAPPPGAEGMLGMPGAQPPGQSELALGEPPPAGDRPALSVIPGGRDRRVRDEPATQLAMTMIKARVNSRDARSVVDVGGLQCIIETQKGERRDGYGWSQVMPCMYGYISGTNSPEGPREQMDCFLGDDLTADRVWVIEQLEPQTKVFDEYKVMLAFPDKDEAVAAYKASYSDGEARCGNVMQMSLDDFKTMLEEWKYGHEPKRASMVEAD